MKENNKNTQTEEQTKKAQADSTETWDDLDVTYDPGVADHLNVTDDLFITDDPDAENEQVPVGEVDDSDKIDSEQADTPASTPETPAAEDVPEEIAANPIAEAVAEVDQEAAVQKKDRPAKEKKVKEKKPKPEKPEKTKKVKAEKPAKETHKEKKAAAKAVKKESPTKPSSAPSPKSSEEKQASILSICLPLVIICIAVSLMLAAVNAVTKDRIAQNAAHEKQNAVLAIFTDATYASLHGTEGTSEIYLAIRDNELVGFCISVPENGFGGAMSLMIGRDTTGAVCGVEIVSMAETPGIGTKTKSPSFLDQFRGSTPFEIGVNMDAISGATISSRAVTRAVNTALSIDLDARSIATANGLTVAKAAEGTTSPVVPDTQPPAEDTTVPDTSDESKAETAPVEDTSAETTGEADTLPVVDPIDTTEDTNDVIIASTDTVFVEDTTEPPTEETTPEPEPEPDTEPVEETTEAVTTGEADTSAEEPTEEDTSAETTGEADTSAEEPTEEDTSAETTGEADTSAENTTAVDTDTATDTTDEFPVA